MKRWQGFAAGLGAYAVALVVGAPAGLLGARLADLSGGRIHLTQAQGTLWSGRGRIELRDDSGRTGLALPCAWRLRPESLWRARLVYALEVGGAAPAAALALSWSRVELSGVAVEIPAAALASLHAALVPLGLTGDVAVRIEGLRLEPDATHGSATLHWRTAGSVLAPVAKLGDYELRMDGHGPVVRATLRTLQGPMDLAGHGAWRRGGAPAFVATARLPPALRATLVPFLRLAAVEQRDGSFVWTLAPRGAPVRGRPP